MRLRGWRALALLVVVLTVVGCGSDGSEVALDGEPEDMLRRAVEQTGGVVRLRVHATTDADLFVVVESAEGIAGPDGDVRVTVTRSFEAPDGEGSGVLGQLRMLEGRTEVVIVDGATYRTLPDGAEDLGGPTLPPGVEWVAEPPGTSTSTPIADVGAYVATRGILDLLDDAAEVEDAGPTEVDGTPARWLKAVAPAEGELADLVGPGTTIDVAVDGDEVVRRIAFVPEGDGFHTQVIVDIFEHGVDEAVVPPSDDVVIDRADLEGSEQTSP